MSVADESTPDRCWTFMVYLAGDNNLENFGVKDLLEMKQIGSNSALAIVAQFDRMSDQATRRYYLNQSSCLENDCVDQLPETNSGDPQTLLDFICWATQTYPSQHYALVLWNHGSGWKDEDIYQAAQRQGLDGSIPRGNFRSLVSGRTSRALFRPTIEQITIESGTRAILFDDTSADFLDNYEMSTLLQQAVSQLGQKIDLLGFDACLMSMLEVVYQVRQSCHIVVGSQEVEPGNGWPYDDILKGLAASPDMSAPDLGKKIVQSYIDYYQMNYPSLAVTQSAVNAGNLSELYQAVNYLASSLLQTIHEKETQMLVSWAQKFTQTFRDPDYYDLMNLCSLLAEEDQEGEIGSAAKEVVRILTGADTPLLAIGKAGSSVSEAQGLSIYLPGRLVSPLYSRLDFAQQNDWDDFLHTYTDLH